MEEGGYRLGRLESGFRGARVESETGGYIVRGRWEGGGRLGGM